MATLLKSASWKIPGFRMRDLTFKVPFCCPGEPNAKRNAGKDDYDPIEVFAREVTPIGDVEKPAASQKPYLVYLQGGPGFQSPYPTAAGPPGWVVEASKNYRVLLLDQRGTGRSTPITAQTLGEMSPAEQAAYMSHFRSDAIVQDCEHIRKLLTAATDTATDDAASESSSKATASSDSSAKWSLLGQSYGGFVITQYVQRYPQCLKEVFFTGGLPLLLSDAALEQGESAADKLYRATFQRVINRNKTYYKKYPEDVALVRKIVNHLRANPDTKLPSGAILSVDRFLFLGFKFGFNGNFDALHQLFETAFVRLAQSDKEVLNNNFLCGLESMSGFFDTNPIYAVLHESIYCDGGVPSNWSAERIRKTLSEFDVDARLAAGDDTPVYFTGEMVFPWAFDSYTQLQPLKECANLLAKKEWPRLYPDAANIPAADEMPRAAAVVYYDDMFVERQYSVETAEKILPGIKLWITNEFDHGGLHSDGKTVFSRLLALAHGEADVR